MNKRVMKDYGQLWEVRWTIKGAQLQLMGRLITLDATFISALQLLLRADKWIAVGFLRIVRNFSLRPFVAYSFLTFSGGSSCGWLLFSTNWRLKMKLKLLGRWRGNVSNLKIDPALHGHFPSFHFPLACQSKEAKKKRKMLLWCHRLRAACGLRPSTKWQSRAVGVTIDSGCFSSSFFCLPSHFFWPESDIFTRRNGIFLGRFLSNLRRRSRDVSWPSGDQPSRSPIRHIR